MGARSVERVMRWLRIILEMVWKGGWFADIGRMWYGMR